MGFWGSKLFDNDTTSDVRDTYEKYLYNQFSDEEAYKNTYKEYEELMGTDEEPLFWYALASIQWKSGRLMPSVKNQAFTWMDKDKKIECDAMSIFMRRKWKKTLQNLKNELESPLPERKEYKKDIFERNLWNIGDVIAYQFHTKDAKEEGLDKKYILIHKIGESSIWLDEEMDRIKIPRVQIYNKVFTELPTIEDVKGLKVLPNINMDEYVAGPKESRDFIRKSGLIALSLNLFRYKKKDYEENYFFYVGNIKNVEFNNKIAPEELMLDSFETVVTYIQPSWKNYDYIIKDDVIQIFNKSNPDKYI